MIEGFFYHQSLKVPKKIDFRDRMPMSSFGKILRREVRKSYWQLIPGQQKLHAALTYLAGMGPTSKVFSGRPALSKMRSVGRVCPAVN